MMAVELVFDYLPTVILRTPMAVKEYTIPQVKEQKNVCKKTKTNIRGVSCDHKSEICN